MPESLPLPEPVRLRPGTPVLLRGPDEVQVGLDPGAAVLLRGAAALQLLARLDHPLPRADLDVCAAGAGLTPAEACTVLRRLQEAGLLDAPDDGVGARRPQVRLIGTGHLGRDLAPLLLDAGIDLHAADLERSGRLPRTPPEPPASPAASRRGRLVPVSHWSKPERDDLRLTVVAADTAEVDRLVTDHLLRTDQPHLLLRSSGSTVTVGPLVLPGRTACVRCTDLRRRDVDPAWPGLLPQLVRLHRPPGSLLSTWAAAVTAAQALAHVHGEVPETAGATLELDSRDHLMRWRAWPQHPACGCAWSGPTEWAP